MKGTIHNFANFAALTLFLTGRFADGLRVLRYHFHTYRGSCEDGCGRVGRPAVRIPRAVQPHSVLTPSPCGLRTCGRIFDCASGVTDTGAIKGRLLTCTATNAVRCKCHFVRNDHLYLTYIPAFRRCQSLHIIWQFSGRVLPPRYHGVM